MPILTSTDAVATRIDEEGKLGRPIALLPELLERVAAGAVAAALSHGGGGTTTSGAISPERSNRVNE